MEKIGPFLLSLAAVFFAVSFLSPARAADAGQAMSFLKASGHDVVDESGNKVFLRGVGLGNWLLPEGYMLQLGAAADRPRKAEALVAELIGKEKAAGFWKDYYDNYITGDDIRLIAGLGFNSVRPALNSRLFLEEEKDETVFREEGFRILDRLVKDCRRYGVYVIIDLHGAPGGQTGANIDDSPGDRPELFTDEVNRRKTCDLWREIARRYRDEPAVAGFDLLNEPLPGKFGEYWKDLFPLYQRITAAIREVDRKHMIILEGADWGGDWSALGPPFDRNMAYSFHKYWNEPDTASIQSHIDKRKEWNIPVWIGETGENSDDWYRAAIQLLEDNNMGWSFWAWKKVGSASGVVSVRPPEGWDRITEYSGTKRSVPAEEAERIFNGLLHNIRMTNCAVNTGVIRSIFRRVPGKIQAENYGHRGSGKSYSVKAGRDNRNYNVGWTEPGEWLAYEVENAEAGTFDLGFRVSAPDEGKRFFMEVDGVDITGPVAVPRTGGWQDWQTVTVRKARIGKGKKILKFVCMDGGFNIDSFTVAPVGLPAPERPENGRMYLGATGRIPGVIQAEQYGTGGWGVSYFDADPKNNGGQFRQDAVDLETASGGAMEVRYRQNEPVPVLLTSENCNVGWMEAGEWLRYDVVCEKSGAYDVWFNVATPMKDRKFSLRVSGKNLTGPVTAVQTSGWQDYRMIVVRGIPFKAGVQKLEFHCDDGGYNLDWISVNPAGIEGAYRRPGNKAMLLGRPGMTPGLLEAEHYGPGGEGVSYHDSTPENRGRIFRNDGVDIQLVSFDRVAGLEKEEWLSYEINSLSQLNLVLKVKFKGQEGPAVLKFKLNGEDAASPVRNESMEFGTFTAGRTAVPAGKNELKVEVIEGSAMIDWLELSGP